MAVSVSAIGPNSPCKSCNKRAMGCHSMCVDYVEWREDHQKRLKKYRKEKSINSDVVGHQLTAMKQMSTRSASEPFRRSNKK